MPGEINENFIFGMIVIIILVFLLTASIFVVYIKKINIKKTVDLKMKREYNLDNKIKKNIYGKLSPFFEETFKTIDEINLNNDVSKIALFKKESKKFITDVMSQKLYKDFKFKSDEWERLDHLLKNLERNSVMTWEAKYKQEIKEVIYGK